MTADAHQPHQRPPARTPAASRAALAGADRAEFERDYQAAVARAAAQYELEPLQEVLDRWWQVAVLTADPAAHQRMLQRADGLRPARSRRASRGARSGSASAFEVGPSLSTCWSCR